MSGFFFQKVDSRSLSCYRDICGELVTSQEAGLCHFLPPKNGIRRMTGDGAARDERKCISRVAKVNAVPACYVGVWWQPIRCAACPPPPSPSLPDARGAGRGECGAALSQAAATRLKAAAVRQSLRSWEAVRNLCFLSSFLSFCFCYLTLFLPLFLSVIDLKVSVCFICSS